jgi:hypothetical protein
MGWSHIVNLMICRPVRGLDLDTDETTREEPESEMEIGESSDDSGRVSELTGGGLPRLDDLLLLEPDARREKPGSPKAGQKGADVYGGVSLDFIRFRRI